MLDLLPPVHLTLARTPTPLEPLTRLDALQGAPVWIKRDDLTGAALTGNKVRKLEFLAADALEKGAQVLITCGATTSNHARATAVVAARLGLRSHLLLRGEDEHPRQGNLLLDTLVGAELSFLPPEAWPERQARMEALAADHAAEGRRAYVIPEGGSNHLGALGYALAVSELLEQEQDLGLKISTIVHACGSGGTTAGLALGVAAAGRRDIDVVGVAVCDDAATFDGIVGRILDASVTAGHVKAAVRGRARWRITDLWKGPGYGQTDDHGWQLIAAMARSEGILLDPVYSGKALAGLVGERSAGRMDTEGAIVFLHTGGLPGLFHHAETIARTLPLVR